MNEHLVYKVFPLILSDDIQPCFLILDKYINCYTNIVAAHHKDLIGSELEGYSKVILQMVLSKAMNLKNILFGVSYKNDRTNIRNFIDPIVLTTISRNLFETLCTFEVLNIIPKTPEQKKLIFTLFMISGYKNRQKFIFEDIEDEYKQQAKEEAAIIKKYEQEIKKSSIYHSLSKSSQSKIDESIKYYNYRICFDENNEIIKLGWEEVLPHVGIQGTLLRKIYSQLSTHAHPSFISVMQFGQMFSDESPQYISSSVVCMRHCFTFLCIFLMDYMKLFPQVRSTYDKMPEEDTTIFELHYKMATTLTNKNQ